MLTKFETKSNRVKGLSFHPRRPWILASLHSGVIQMWDYRMGTLLDRFDEHDGPVRGVHFHATQPLFVSGGDDYKIKVWNYKTHRCLFTLTGHLDYIRTVQFHHEYPWIVSASDDQTIRIWNWQSRTCVAVLTGHNHYVMCASFHPKEDLVVSASLDQTVRVWDIGALRKKTVSPADDILRLTQMNTDLFGGVDAVVKYVLEGHDRGVNWASFHPTLPLIVSGADDRQVKLWRMNGNSIPRLGKFLRFFEYSTQKEVQVAPIRRPGSVSLNQAPRTLSYSPTENAVLICSDVDGGSYDLYIVPKDSAGRADYLQEAKKGAGGSAVFVARNRFAVLEKSSNQVLVKNLKNEIVKKSPLPIATDAIYYAGTGNLLCKAEDRVTIFDLQQRLVLGELQSAGVKYVVWSSDMEYVALLSKHAVVIASKKLVHRSTLHETIRVKSGAWDENGVFIYSTLNHIKYCLPNGDSGIIKTLDVPVYITRVIGNNIFCLDRDGKNKLITVDASEYIFKLALLRKRYDHVMSMIKSSQLCGQAVISYLQQKGFPEVALHFVKDEKTRFNLALESGNIQIAVASAKEIDDKDHWYRLGIEALRQGNVGIVEYAYQRTKNFERLTFLYLITGYMDKVGFMCKIAGQNNNLMGQFHNALYLGDARKRAEILENAGQLPLAYVTAATHGLTEIAERLAAELGENVPSLPEGKTRSLLIPPAPLISSVDWPLLRVMRGIFEGGLDATGRAEVEEDDEAAGADWGDEDLDIVDASDAVANGGDGFDPEEGEANEVDGEEGGWDLEDLELPEPETPKAAGNARSTVFVAPTPGMPVSQIWTQKSSLAGEHAAAGNFDTAMRLLSRQLGIKNFAPLKPMFLDLHMGSHSYLRALATAPVISIAVEKGWSESSSPNVRGPPSLVFTFSQMEDRLKAAYKATTEGKFPEALRQFLNILHTIPLIVVDSRREVDEVKELIEIVREYVLGLRMELKRKELKDNVNRQQELAAYFTNCKLQRVHMRLVLSNAMALCYKQKNFATAEHFARLLLENSPNEVQAKKARQVQQQCNGKQDSHELNYDYRNPFVVCGSTYVPIYRGQKDISCPYCGSRFVPNIEGQLCTICELAVVGADASGLLCSPTQTR
uniref:Coatomer subunit alpha n=1 Tax=Aegilops tauschii subsp. strangulata TaxID=200361 RepID=A0A453H749_AEGTS